MNLEKIREICQGKDYQIIEDPILMATAEIGANHYGIALSECTPTLILKVENNFIAIIIQGNKKLDFKKIKQYFSSNKVTMATKEEIFQITHSPIGSVSLINPNLKTLLDKGVKEIKYCYGGSGTEKYTLKIKTLDLIELIELIQPKMGDFTKS